MTTAAAADASKASLLLEIGCEELPSSFVDAALAALPPLVAGKLAALRIAHGEVRALGTARRLSVLVHDVAARQLDLDEEVLGPPETAAFKDGKPTRAAEAFAQKLGVSMDDLRVVDKEAAGKQKAGRYVVARKQETGRSSTELLGIALAELITAIPFRKSMRWGAGDATFGRPVQWLVALYGDKPIAVSFAGVASATKSRGHRFLAPAEFAVSSADAYVHELRERNVLVDRQERADHMMALVKDAAAKAGGVHDPEPYLVDENASLVEEPYIVTGSFDPAFLELPASLIRSVARGHQKYFCVQNANNPDQLLPHYLCVANTANRPDLVAKGNDRVMRARLSDARFFFDEDKKVGLASRVDKLHGIVFHNRLGTVKQKVERIKKLVTHICTDLHLSNEEKAQAAQAAELCKADLVTLMVGEFPELQGEMGRAYALSAKMDPAVADAIRDHYKPAGASDDVAPSAIAAAIGLADRLDTLVGCFAIGLSPSGSADPFALRRACLGILRTLTEKAAAGDQRFAEVDWRGWLGAAFDGYEGTKLDLSRQETIEKVTAFATDRLKGLLQSESSTGVADTVLAGQTRVHGAAHPVVAFPAYAMWKAKGIQTLAEGTALKSARTVAKRLRGISGDAKPVRHDASTFTDEDDKKIANLVQALEVVTSKPLTTAKAVEDVAQNFATSADQLEEIFVKKLVNDPKDPKTAERLETLSFGAQCMLLVGDFSKLS